MEQNHQQQQFITLLQRHNGVIYKILKKYCQEQSWQDDLYQDICLRAWDAYNTFQGRSEFSSWLHRVALNTAVSRLRKAKLKLIFTDNIFYEIADTPYQEDKVVVNSSALDKLTVCEKETLELRMEGLSFAEISERTGEPINRLTVRMHRIKKELSKSIRNVVDI